MKAGSIALAQLQQADGRSKLRPVLILNRMPPFDDYLVCALSSKLHHEVKGFDEIIGTDAGDFSRSGLKVASLMRLGMIATLPDSAVRGRLGSIDDDRLERLRSRLADKIKERES